MGTGYHLPANTGGIAECTKFFENKATDHRETGELQEEGQVTPFVVWYFDFFWSAFIRMAGIVRGSVGSACINNFTF